LLPGHHHPGRSQFNTKEERKRFESNQLGSVFCCPQNLCGDGYIARRYNSRFAAFAEAFWPRGFGLAPGGVCFESDAFLAGFEAALGIVVPLPFTGLLLVLGIRLEAIWVLFDALLLADEGAETRIQPPTLSNFGDLMSFAACSAATVV
jgi:hypothetical protein